DREENCEDSGAEEIVNPKPIGGFFGKLIPWLGEFHPPAVHFPIPLLTAAAVAELRRLVTGNQAFHAHSRHSVWLGNLTAGSAAILGWCAGGFYLTDASWTLTTHRWLGTSTLAWAGLVLVLGETSRRSDRQRARLWFRLTLLVGATLVLVTGFFGGAIVL